MDLKSLCQHFQLITRIYPENTARKNYFIAACKTLDNSIILDIANTTRPYGGTIGIGNSRLDVILKHFKIFRLHAILHDAAGYMRDCHEVGPGYCYVWNNFPINSCLLGHITGLSYCIYLKLFNSYYEQLVC